jgi:Aspartyl/Asparaginyl beta-hydroxylase
VFMLRMVERGYADTSALLSELTCSMWNTLTFRTENPNSPHREVSDIWVRYNPIENYRGDMREFNSEHVSRWYKVAEELPEAKRLSEKIAQDFHAIRLGAVLITKIPAGKTCYPHVDMGWHARYYEKFALQIAGNVQQSFSVEHETLRTESGDLFWFDNSRLHWVLNPSQEDRITMIVCLRRH